MIMVYSTARCVWPDIVSQSTSTCPLLDVLDVASMVLQEYLLTAGTPSAELLGMMGIFGSLISAVQVRGRA